MIQSAIQPASIEYGKDIIVTVHDSQYHYIICTCLANAGFKYLKTKGIWKKNNNLKTRAAIKFLVKDFNFEILEGTK